MTVSAAPGPMVTEPFITMAKPVGPVCNLDCGYCYYLSRRGLFPRGERFRMRPEVLEAHIRAVIEAGPGPVVQLVWHGGEPTLAGLDLYRRVVELERRHLPEGWTCINNLQTNGTLLDDAWCAFLAENGFTVGLSLDGPARIHDAGRSDRRHRPTHGRVLEGLRRLRAHGIEPDVLCTLTARSAAAPQEVYRFFLDQGVRWLQFLPVVGRDAAGRVTPDTVPAPAMASFLIAIFDEWVRHDVGRIGVQNFLEPLLVVAGHPANLCVMAETCGRALAVEHDGGVYSCDHFVDPAHRLGSLLEEPLAGLLEAPAQVAFGRAKRDTLPSICRTCPVLRLCNGGCPKDRFVTAPGGEPGLSWLCAGYRTLYTHIVPVLERMRALTAGGHPLTAIMDVLGAEEAEERRRWRSTPRNAPCPCGSGRKYKHCCLGTRRT